MTICPAPTTRIRRPASRPRPGAVPADSGGVRTTRSPAASDPGSLIGPVDMSSSGPPACSMSTPNVSRYARHEHVEADRDRQLLQLLHRQRLAQRVERGVRRPHVLRRCRRCSASPGLAARRTRGRRPRCGCRPAAPRSCRCPRLMRSCWYTSYVASDSTPTRTMAISRSTGSSLRLEQQVVAEPAERPQQALAAGQHAEDVHRRVADLGERLLRLGRAARRGRGTGCGPWRAIIVHPRARWERRPPPAVPSCHQHSPSRKGSTQMALTVAAQKPMHETQRLAFDGAVDADGHILEPPDLWETYIDPKYRDRALRFVLDEHGPRGARDRRPALDDEPPRLPVDARRDGRRPTSSAMQKDPERTYLGEAPYGSDGPERAHRGARRRGHRRRRSSTRPSACCGRPSSTTPSCRQAYTTRLQPLDLRVLRGRAAARPDRAPVAERSGGRGQGARAGRRRGRQGRATSRPFTHDGRPLGHPDNDPVFAAAQDLDVPFAIHPTFEPQWTKGTRMGTWENVKQLRLLASVTGVRRRAPPVHDAVRLRRVRQVPAAQGRSCSSRAAAGSATGSTASTPSTATRSSATRVPLEHKPSDYFRERVWISCDPDERTIPALAERFGVDRFLWASDFPHADHTPEYVARPQRARRRVPRRTSARTFLGDNARELFQLDGPAT